jgi:hypothetical protein
LPRPPFPAKHPAHKRLVRQFDSTEHRNSCDNRGKALDELVCDIRDVIILHLSYLFFSKQNYMASCDHIDALECGCIPEPDSEYWVAPFVQKMFNTLIVQYRPDIAKVIKENTSMQLK